MKYANFLKDQGTIGFVAPSFGCATEPYSTRYDSMLNNFKKLGYSTIEGPNCRLAKGVGISNTPIECAKEFVEAYCDERSDVLISSGGGELMCEILPYIDFEKIRNAKPKWFMGYSDNTNLTFLLTTLTDTASIYGYCGPTFGMQVWDKSLQDNLDAICGKYLVAKGYDKWEIEPIDPVENPLASYNLTMDKVIVKYPDKDASFSGRLLGGCLDCLVNLCGTEFDKVSEFVEKYKNDGIIWFIESCDLPLFSIRRSIWNLKNAGWFKYTKGFLFGRPRTDNGASYMGLDQYSAVTELLKEYNVPIIMDMDFGHLPPAIPIICGSYACVTVKENDFTIDMKLI